MDFSIQTPGDSVQPTTDKGKNMKTQMTKPNLFAICAALALVSPSSLPAQAPDDQLPASFVSTMRLYSIHGSSTGAGGGVLGRRANGSLLGIDSLTNFSSYFYDPGVIDQFGDPQFTWPYTFVGNSPFLKDGGDGHGSATIPAPIVPVTIDLRNFDGTPRFVNGKPLISSPAPYVQPVLNSPIFQNSSYDSSKDPTQFTDAVQRAEFPGADDKWHTMLDPSVKAGRTMVLIRGSYRFALNSDGTCCADVLVDINTFTAALFPPGPGDTTTVMGQAETAGDVRTSDLSTFLFPNTFLYFNGDPTQCCVLGFHSYDLEPGDAKNGFQERRYVMDYASWISPGLFGSSFVDVTGLSHELSEAFNDPFVNNATPFWLAPNGNCQNNLETGDVIEGLPHAAYLITLKGVTYHPQNEALLQWFAGQTPSSAIGGAYSYPDKSVLTAASKSQKFGCAP
jgi:hypothetical protein